VLIRIALAAAMTDADAKETLLRTARDYERLAQRAESDCAFSRCPSACSSVSSSSSVNASRAASIFGSAFAGLAPVTAKPCILPKLEKATKITVQRKPLAG
jgi:hypothetical protein